MLQLTIAAGRPLRGLALALAAEHQYVGWLARRVPLTLSFQIGVSCFGAPFFIVSLAQTLYSMRVLTDRNRRLEAAGKIIPDI